MRKTGIYILLGITLSLGVFVFAGIVYFRPAVQQARLDTAQSPVGTPSKEPVVIPKAPAVTTTVEKPVATVVPPTPISQPVGVDSLEVPGTELPAKEPELAPVVSAESQPSKPRVPSAPVMTMTVAAYKPPVQVEPEPIGIVEEVEPVAIEEQAVPSIAVTKVEPEPEVYDRPVKRLPPTPAVERSVLSVLPFLPPKPVEYIWTPVTIPEGPTEHVDPISFSKEAFERRRIAVDEVLDKLIWE